MTRIIVGIGVLAMIVAVAILLLIILWPQNFRPSVTAAGGIDPGVFKDGMGIYVFNNNQYRILVWKKKLIGPNGAMEEKDILEASRQAIPVNKGVRFFAYGMDISKWPVVPPYSMAFCVARDAKTIEGIFPIRIKPLDQNTYELIMPPQIDNLASGAMSNLFWFVNFQYSCNEGWVFKFQ
jgi:hypothetical protein